MTSSHLQSRVNEVESIVDQLERTFEGDAWHGQSLSEILTCITASQAAARPIRQAHSIWEIVLHTTAWQRAVRRRLEGHPITDLPDELDWPGVDDTSDAAWTSALSELRSEYEKSIEAARQWSERDLGEITEGQRFTVYQMLHGVIQHNLYHAGQIAILKKATAEEV